MPCICSLGLLNLCSLTHLFHLFQWARRRAAGHAYTHSGVLPPALVSHCVPYHQLMGAATKLPWGHQGSSLWAMKNKVAQRPHLRHQWFSSTMIQGGVLATFWVWLAPIRVSTQQRGRRRKSPMATKAGGDVKCSWAHARGERCRDRSSHASPVSVKLGSGQVLITEELDVGRDQRRFEIDITEFGNPGFRTGLW